jgi:hypothetical protein
MNNNGITVLKIIIFDFYLGYDSCYKFRAS